MNVIVRDYVFIGMDKTGSTSLRRLIRRIEDAWTRFPQEQTDQLPLEAQGLPVIGSIRNPFTWYPSYWAWYKEARFQDGWRGISLEWPDWVRTHKDWMEIEFNRLYFPDTHIVRMEYQSEDLIRILTEIKGPLSDEVVSTIRNAEIGNINPNPKPPVTDELKPLILEGAFSIFEKYYPGEE